MLYFSKVKLVIIYFIIIFLAFFSSLKKFVEAKKDKKIMIKYIVNILIFEKYNTKYIYFFVLEIFAKLCIVDWTTCIVTFSEIDKSILSSS